jgi:hypothetical protein
MPKKDPRVDAYIAKAAPFARPILTHLRRVIHQGCPEIEETIKWGMPSFEHHGLLCGIAAFQQHCALGFWRERKIQEQIPPPETKAMGQFGRIESLDDLPSDAKLLRLETAVEWIAEGKPQNWKYTKK